MQIRADRDDLIDMFDSFSHVAMLHTEIRSTSRIARTETDSVRLEDFPKRASIKVALRQTIGDMLYLRAATRGQDNITMGQRAAANVFTLAMIYHNGKAGRCGEWMKPKYKTTKQRLFVERSDFSMATEHKRSKQRGVSSPGAGASKKKESRIHMSLPEQRKQIDLSANRPGAKGSSLPIT